MKFRYKIGNYVVTKGGEEGKIISLAEKCQYYDEESYEVEFTNKALIPPTMWYPYFWLNPCKNPMDSFCPICNTKWLETSMGNHKWRDCKPCGKREEDILKEMEEVAKLPPIPEEDDLEDWLT